MRLCAALWLIIFSISCKSLPQTPESYLEAGTFPLESGALVYILADVNEARSIIDVLPINELNDKQVVQLLNRTNVAMAAIYPEEKERHFHLAAWGNYPKSGAGMALSFNKDWKKQKSVTKQNYWHSAANKLSVALLSRHVFVVVSLNDSPEDPFIGSAKVPDGFAEFSRIAPASLWIEKPGPIFQSLLNNAGVPVRVPVNELFVNMFNPAPEQYEAVIRLQFENAIQARGVAAVLNLAGRFTSNDPDLMIAMLFISNPPVQNGRNLDIKTGLINEEKLLQIFKTLSI